MSIPKRLKGLFSKHYSDEQLLAWLSSKNAERSRKAEVELYEYGTRFYDLISTRLGLQQQEEIFYDALDCFVLYAQKTSTHIYILEKGVKSFFQTFFEDRILIAELKVEDNNVKNAAGQKLYKRLKEIFKQDTVSSNLPTKDDAFSEFCHKIWVCLSKDDFELKTTIDAIGNRILSWGRSDYFRKQNSKKQALYNTDSFEDAVIIDKTAYFNYSLSELRDIMRAESFSPLQILSLNTQDYVSERLKKEIEMDKVHFILHRMEKEGSKCPNLFIYLGIDKFLFEEEEPEGGGYLFMYQKMAELGFDNSKQRTPKQIENVVKKRTSDCRIKARKYYQELMN